MRRMSKTFLVNILTLTYLQIFFLTTFLFKKAALKGKCMYFYSYCGYIFFFSCLRSIYISSRLCMQFPQRKKNPITIPRAGKRVKEKLSFNKFSHTISLARSFVFLCSGHKLHFLLRRIDPAVNY